MKRVEVITIAALLMAGLAMAAPMPLEDALKALQTYEFGQSREALTVITDNIRAVQEDAAATGEIEAKLAEMLPGAPVDAQRYICRELDVIGTAKSVPAVAGLLTDEAVGDTALHTLEVIPGPEALNALQEALAAAPAGKKGVYILALGRRGDAASVAVVKPFLSDGDPALVSAAVKALADIGGAEASASVLAAVDTVPDAVRLDAYNSALRCADAALEKGDAVQALGVYERFIAPERPVHIRIAALGGFVKADPDNAGEQIIAALDDSAPEMVRAVLEHVRVMPAELVEKHFSKGLDPEGGAKTISLIRALSERESGAPLKAIAACATGGSKDVKLAAVQALGKVGDVSCVPLLLDVAVNGIGVQYRAARESLSTLPGADVNAALLEYTGKGKSEERAEAVLALAERRAFEATPRVIELAGSEDEKIRESALKALQTLAGEKDIPALFALLNGSQGEEAAAVMDTIVAVARRIPDAQKRTDLIASQLENAAPAAKVALLDALGQLPSPASMKVLIASLGAAEAPVRIAAEKALGAWNDGAPLDSLTPLIETAKGEEKEAVLDAVAGLLRKASDRSDEYRIRCYRILLKQDLSEGQKKTVLAGLSQIIHPDALELVSACRDDDAVAAEAAVGVLQIARGLSGAYPEKALEAIGPWLESSDESLKSQAQAVKAAVDGMKGWITAWEVSGPYMQPGLNAHMLFEKALLPETDPDKAVWRIMPMAKHPEHAWIIDLGRAIGGNERVVYLRTTLESDAARDVVLELGSNDLAKVWLNGKLVHSMNRGRGLNPGDDKVKVKLDKGANSLMMAIYQLGGEWSACLRLQNAGGVTASIE